MRAKFSELSYTGAAPKCCAQAGGEKEPWLTAEQIPVKGCYSAADLEGMEHLNYAAGVAPFLRGPYSTMYVMRPWTIRQYAGFSTAEESNAFYRRNLASGQKGTCISCGTDNSCFNHNNLLHLRLIRRSSFHSKTLLYQSAGLIIHLTCIICNSHFSMFLHGFYFTSQISPCLFLYYVAYLCKNR